MASGKQGLVLEWMPSMTIQHLGISIILFWRNEGKSEIGDDDGEGAEITQMKELLVIL